MSTRFVVPQFIEEESRILGKITVRQFIILMIAFVVLMIVIRVGSLAAIILTLIFFVGPAVVLALVKINGQPFHYFILNVIQTLRKPSLRIWNKRVSVEDIRFELQRRKMLLKKPVSNVILKDKPASSKLAELSLIVDTGGMYKGE